MREIITLSIVMVMVLFLAISCTEKDFPPETKPVVYDDTPYQIQAIEHFPPAPISTDNSLTEQGVLLGKMLFYETRLSEGNVISCASCHIQSDGFSDLNQFSFGIENQIGNRQAMPLFNLAWHSNGFFWDGRAATLREQALLPIEDPLEMGESLDDVIDKLSDSKTYTDQFVRAFGNNEITADKIALAIEQFMLTIVSANSKYDQYLFGNYALTEQEEKGRQLFFTEFDPLGEEKGAECFHCHGGYNFTNDKFMNNGLDADIDFSDLGRYNVTQNEEDKAKFLTPTLRNIELTAPYMHDGRFSTLEEVLDHYNEGVVHSSTIDILMQFNLNPGIQLSEDDKFNLIAFLKTLTDESFVNNTEFANPFE